MMRHYRHGCLILCLALFGSGCAQHQVIPPAECVPDIRGVERLIPLDADLTQPQPCPAVPRTGSNEHLADWAENCAISARMANDQLARIRALQRSD